ncbi:MAG TPA: AraC family transcriptional regulator [Sphaerochaetaceae bacterium]|nr:AraC family transcriptional regulator [Sphaerochaetaceae bacterium]
MLERLNRTIDYIEEHLSDELSVEELETITGNSLYHFNKVFLYLSGYTLKEYIRTRRLSEANRALLEGASVTTVAFTYGYNSLDGFTRAFKKWSGILPSEVQSKGFSKTTQRLTFTITVTGGDTMECRIVEMPAFNFVGVSKRVPMQFEGINQEIVKLAQSITSEQGAYMHSLQNMEPYEIVNVSYDADENFMKEEGDLTHLIGVLTTEDTIEPLLDKIPVEAMSWAVFPNEGPFPATLQNTMAQVYAQWLPLSDYEVVQAPTFSFTTMDKDRESFAYSEVWIPVRKRSF